jgi:hypothetical protein
MDIVPHKKGSRKRLPFSFLGCVLWRFVSFRAYLFLCFYGGSFVYAALFLFRMPLRDIRLVFGPPPRDLFRLLCLHYIAAQFHKMLEHGRVQKFLRIVFRREFYGDDIVRLSDNDAGAVFAVPYLFFDDIHKSDLSHGRRVKKAGIRRRPSGAYARVNDDDAIEIPAFLISSLNPL